MYGYLLNRLVELCEILYGGDIVWDRDEITFNPIASTILKWFVLQFVWWIHYLHHSALLSNGLGLFSVFGFPWLHHTPYLANITMEIKVCRPTLPKVLN
jgi:hypothetical protein